MGDGMGWFANDASDDGKVNSTLLANLLGPKLINSTTVGSNGDWVGESLVNTCWCFDMRNHEMLWDIMIYHDISSEILIYHQIWYHIISYHIISYPTISTSNSSGLTIPTSAALMEFPHQPRQPKQDWSLVIIAVPLLLLTGWTP